jgi:hypothetical protein
MADEAENTTEDQTSETVVARRGRPPKVKNDLFPVILAKNYHPVNEFTIDGAEPSPEQRVKVFAGTAIEMDRDEARDVIAKGIAIRNDPI